MKRIIALILFATIVYSYSYSQKGIYLGCSPISYIKLWVNGNDDVDFKAKFGFKDVVGFQLGYEWINYNNTAFLAEISYFKGKFNDVEIEDSNFEFDPFEAYDYKDINFTFYKGKTINYGKRFQFPIYLGLGLNYLEGGMNAHLYFQIAAKARVLFYIFNNMGLYAGATGKVGFADGISYPGVTVDTGFMFNF